MRINTDDDNGHVLFHRFGLEQAQHEGLLDQILHDTPAVRSTAAAQLSLMAYQTDYGIYDHRHPDPERPLALIAMHPKENTYEGGPLFSIVRRFHNYRIMDLGYSLEDFLNLPYPVAMLLFEIAEHDITQKDTKVSKAEKELTQAMIGQ